MSNPIVSVVVPCTAERHLVTICLQTIRNQSLQHLEIICIDNHADSETRSLVDQIAATDRRVRVAECKTRGSGPARNKGIQVARGKYVAFVDADDFLPNPASLQLLYEAAETRKADLARGNVYVWRGGAAAYSALDTLGQRIWFYGQTLTTYEKEPLLWLPVQHQAYLFRRDYLVRRRLFYPHLLRGQDQPFLLNVMLSGPKVVVTDHPAYVYRKGHRGYDVLAQPRNYLDRMISIKMIKSALLERRLEVQWHLVFARMANYMERVTVNFPRRVPRTGLMRVIGDIVCGLGRFGTLDYRPYNLGSAGQDLLKQAMQHGWT